MSYDFRLCLPIEGRTPEEIVARRSKLPPPVDPEPEKEERRRRVATALIQKNPAFQAFGLNLEEIAELTNITVEEARRKHRYIELDLPKHGHGILIGIGDDEAVLQLPYWHQGRAARHVFKELWSYLELMQREGGYFTYDRQLERVLNLKRDLADSMDCYQGLRKQYEARTTPPVSKRWWQFWK